MKTKARRAEQAKKAKEPRGYTLDTGALIAAERKSELVWALFDLAAEEDITLTVPSCVVAQAWRERSVQIARLLKGCEIEELTIARAKTVGLLLGETGNSDVVDAAVVAGAVLRDDAVVTSDRGDIERLGKVKIIDV